MPERESLEYSSRDILTSFTYNILSVALECVGSFLLIYDDKASLTLDGNLPRWIKIRASISFLSCLQSLVWWPPIQWNEYHGSFPLVATTPWACGGLIIRPNWSTSPRKSDLLELRGCKKSFFPSTVQPTSFHVSCQCLWDFFSFPCMLMFGLLGRLLGYQGGASLFYFLPLGYYSRIGLLALS